MSAKAASSGSSQPIRNDSVLPAHLRKDVVDVPVTPTLSFKNNLNTVHDYFERQSGPGGKVKTQNAGNGRQEHGNIISATFTIPTIVQKKNGAKWVSV